MMYHVMEEYDVRIEIYPKGGRLEGSRPDKLLLLKTVTISKDWQYVKGSYSGKQVLHASKAKQALEALLGCI